ncbi:Beta-adducin [Fukomys damarensis]|uniref:Beta-adducin n=1 Tax=Fukomys damarensis TaxID=885580 RepID=A0A091EKQ1_FUKDA|nr:Beta-adducin [Fukomys damarensis]
MTGPEASRAEVKEPPQDTASEACLPEPAPVRVGREYTVTPELPSWLQDANSADPVGSWNQGESVALKGHSRGHRLGELCEHHRELGWAGLRNHGVVALGDSIEEAFYKVFHLQAACEIQKSALSSAGGVENLILLEQEIHRPHEVGSVQWARSTFGPMKKSQLGEYKFEALARMLENLGYRTGYTYCHPFVQEKTKHKSEVEVPTTLRAFVFEEDGAPGPALGQHTQKQKKRRSTG